MNSLRPNETPTRFSNAFWRQLGLGTFVGPMVLVVVGLASGVGWLDGFVAWILIFLILWLVIFMTLRTRRGAFVLGLGIGLALGFIVLKVVFGL